MMKLLQESVTKKTNQAIKASAYVNDHKEQIAVMEGALKDIAVLHAWADHISINISISGDKQTLNAVFKAFRNEGYKPSSRPESNAIEFTTYFDRDDCQFYLSFSSTQCTRTKVRTEMQAVDIYEVVCA